MNPFLNFKEDMWIRPNPLDDMTARENNPALEQLWTRLLAIKAILTKENSHGRYYDIIFWRPKGRLVIFRKLWKECDKIVDQYCELYNELKKEQ